MLRAALTRAFYDPARDARRHPNIRVHPTAILLGSARFDFRLGTPNPVRIGRESMVGCNFTFESAGGEIEVGERCFINGGTSLIARTGIYLGNDVMVGWGCTLLDHNAHSLRVGSRLEDMAIQRHNHAKNLPLESGKEWADVASRPIHVEDQAWIGFGAVILAGVTVGRGAVVGACSVVREDVQAGSVVMGNPARAVTRP